MTREEAIKHIRFVLSALNENSQIAESYRMAIKALEQEPKTDSWSIKDVADTFKKYGLIREQEPKTDVLDTIRTEIEELADADGYGDYQLGFSFGLMMAMEIIDKYKAESEDNG